MEIIKGKIASAQKVVIYGPEGIGKSTFAAAFPDPVFIDTEGSTKNMDVSRLPKASSWTMLMEQIRYIKQNSGICKTLVVDTIDWAEQMCVESICSQHGKKGIEDFGYGNGYVYVKEEFGRFLNLLEEVVEAGINIVLTAHAQIKKFEQPDELGAYDRYELKLGKKTSSQTSPLVKEWADMVLFANYKTMSVAVDDKGKKHKAQGGTRIMYTAHHPCWDAKNRHSLPEEMPFHYSGISHIFATSPAPIQHTQAVVQETPISPPITEPKEEPKVETAIPEVTSTLHSQNIPKALLDLMEANNVGEWDIQAVVAARGYYPEGTLIENYELDFINGVLVAAWPQVYGMIKEMKEKQAVPFN